MTIHTAGKTNATVTIAGAKPAQANPETMPHSLNPTWKNMNPSIDKTSFSFARSKMIVALAACTLFGGAVISNPAAAAAPMVKTQAPGYYRIMLGSFEITGRRW